MTDKKQCSKCKVFQPLNYYSDECKQCKNCLEAKQRYREKNRDNLGQYAIQYHQRRKEQTTEEKKDTNELKTECPVCGSIINKYQVKRHEESIKHQTKLKGKEKPKVVRNGDDETGMLGIWNLNPNIKPQQPKQILPPFNPNINSES